MLNPNEIKTKKFEKGNYGYKTEEVDAFLGEIFKDYTQLYAENQDSESKIIKLVEKINEYREDEDAIKSALLSAQKEGKRILAEAKEKAEKMLSDAAEEQKIIAQQSAIECEKIINEHKERCARLIKENTEATEAKIAAVKRENEMQENRLKEIRVEVSDFKASLTAILNKQLNLIAELPEVSDIVVIQPKVVDEKLQEATGEAIVETVEETVNEVNDKQRDSKFANLRFGNNN